MNNNSSNGTAAKSCDGFNFCFWAKLLVAIPTLPVVAYAVSLFFANPALKCLAAIGTVMVLVYLANKVEHLPALQKKLYDPKKKQ